MICISPVSLFLLFYVLYYRTHRLAVKSTLTDFSLLPLSRVYKDFFRWWNPFSNFSWLVVFYYNFRHIGVHCWPLWPINVWFLGSNSNEHKKELYGRSHFRNFWVTNRDCPSIDTMPTRLNIISSFKDLD